MHKVTAPAPRSAPAIRPFPWATLDATTRDEAGAVRALRRWGSANVRLDALARALGDVIGARVAILPKRVERVNGARGTDDGVGLVLGDASSGDMRRAALLEVEGALAAAIVSRGVRRVPPRVVDAARQASPVIAGALGAIVVAAARRAHNGVALRVLAAGPASALARDVSALDREHLQASFTVLVDDDAYHARVTVTLTTAMHAPDPPWTSETLSNLGDVMLAVPIVACATLASAGEMGALQRGDAWMPGDWPLHKTKLGTLAGPVFLATASSEIGVRADLGEDDRLVLRGDISELAWAPSGKENDVSDQAKSDALVEAIGEVPIVVRVEIGIAEMRAREWAALGRGDVISLGRKIGEPVTLRVGGVAVAKGELVEIDGEVGVRILGRADGSDA